MSVCIYHLYLSLVIIGIIVFSFFFLLQSDVVPVIAFLGIFQESCMFLYSKVMFFSSFFFHFKFSLSLQDVFISNNI